MLCVGLLTTIKISGAAALRGWVVSDAGLASGTTGLELVGAPGDLDSVSAPGVAVLGVWDSEPVWRCLELTWSRSGRSQEKRASLPEHQRLASGHVSGKLIGASDH